MFTIIYRGVPIHGYCDRDEVRIQFESGTRTCRSLVSAQRLITLTKEQGRG